LAGSLFYKRCHGDGIVSAPLCPARVAGNINRSERKGSSYTGFADVGVDVDGPSGTVEAAGNHRRRSGSVVSTFDGFGDDTNDAVV